MRPTERQHQTVTTAIDKTYLHDYRNGKIQRDNCKSLYWGINWPFVRSACKSGHVTCRDIKE